VQPAELLRVAEVVVGWQICATSSESPFAIGGGISTAGAAAGAVTEDGNALGPLTGWDSSSPWAEEEIGRETSPGPAAPMT